METIDIMKSISKGVHDMIKKTVHGILMVSVLSFLILLWGCQSKEEKISYHIFGEEQLIAARFDGLWGYIDQDGDVIIDFQYESASSFHHGFAIVMKENLYHLIDVNNQYVNEEGYPYLKQDQDQYFFVYNERMGLLDQDGSVLANPVYDVVVNENVLDAQFYDDLARVSVNGKFSFISRDGNVKMSATEYQEVRHFNKGYAMVSKNGLYGMMNKEGDLIIPCIYKELSNIDPNGFFIGKTAEDYYVLLNEDHDVVVEAVEIQNVFNQLYLVKPDLISDDEFILYDQQGALMDVELTESFVEHLFEELRIPLNKQYAINFQINLDEIITIHIYDAKDQLVFTIFEGDYDGSLHFIYDEKNTLYVMRQVSNWNDFLKEIYVDDGKEIIKVTHDDVKQLFLDMVVAANDGKYGVVNRQRETVIPFEYEDLLIFSDGIIAMKDGKYGVISHKGEIIIPFLYESLIPSHLIPPHDKFSPYDFMDYIDDNIS